MPEYLPQNEHPINQAARRHLLAHRQQLNDDYLYAVQLMLWALESRELSVNPTYGDRLQDWVAGLLSRPVAAVKLVLETEDGQPTDDIADLARLSALDLAKHLLNALHYRLIAEDVGYEQGPESGI
jgi:hypothetical protein